MVAHARRATKRNIARHAALACLGLLATQTFAALQPVSEAPLALDQRNECRFNRDGTTDCVISYRYTILRDAGREALSRIDIDFPETDAVSIERAELIQPGQKPVPLAKSQIDTRTAPNPDQGFIRDKQTSLAFPNLRVGSTVAYTVRHHYSAVPSAQHFHYSISFTPSDVRYDRFHAEFSADRPIRYRSAQAEAFSITPSADAKKLVVDLKSPRFVSYIDEANNAYVRSYPRIELGSSLDLQDNIGPFAKRYSELLASPLPARATAAVAKTKTLAPRERVSALMQYMNEHYRYLSDWRASERGLVPFSLAEIERHGYGDCKDLSMMLTAMLRAAGFKAEPAWVERGDSPASLLAPSIFAVNHAIVRAEVAGSVWWLDPTNIVFAPGVTMPDIQDRWALVMGENGVVRQDTIPADPVRIGLEGTFGERFADGEKASIDATLALGPTMLMQLAASDRNAGKSASDSSLCNLIANEPSQCRVERAATGFLIADRYIAKARLKDLSALDFNAGKYRFNRANLTELWDSLARYKRTGQLLDLYLGAPETTKADFALVAAGVQAQTLECAVNSRWFELVLNGKRTSDGYRYQYQLTRKVAWLSHDDIVSAEFQKMAKQSRDCVSRLQFDVQPMRN
jgi:transglutaminase-like putative cysteine protease